MINSVSMLRAGETALLYRNEILRNEVKLFNNIYDLNGTLLVLILTPFKEWLVRITKRP